MRFQVGYALQLEKVGSVIQPSLVAHCNQRDIDLIQVDLCKPLVDQGPFHCLIHKLYTLEWKSQLVDFQSMYPDAIIIDSPSDIERLHDRASMLDAVDGLCIGIPKQVVARDSVSLFSDASLALNFPVIAKPLLANGTDLSHEMCLVFNSDGLNKLKPPVVLQEFINHGAILFKVYVAGNHVKCVKRTSLPDFSKEEVESILAKGEEAFMPFSQVSSLDASDKGEQQHEPPLESIHNIAKGLREATKLHLFNFDMIRDVKAVNSNTYYIIDINYFPGFAKVLGYENMLTDFFCDIVTGKQIPDDISCNGKEHVAEVPTQHLVIVASESNSVRLYA